MSETLAEWIGPVVIAAGTGLVTAFITRIFERKKYKVELEQAKNTATQQVQDTYQQLIADLREEVRISKAERAELREELDKAESDRRAMKDALYSLLEYTCREECPKRHRLPSKEIETIMERLK